MASFYPMRLAPDPVSVTMPTVLRRDRGGADDRSALAVLKRRQGQHAGRRFGDAAEGTNQVHLDPLLPDQPAGPRETGIHFGIGRHIDLAEDAADVTGDPLAKLGIEIEQRDLDAARGEPPRGRGPEAGRAAGDNGSD